MKKNNKITTYEEHLTKQYGAIGIIGEILKEERKQAKLTQEQLANKIGAKKSYISRVENGKTDIQLSTLYRLFEVGLGKSITISVSD